MIDLGDALDPSATARNDGDVRQGSGGGALRRGDGYDRLLEAQ